MSKIFTKEDIITNKKEAIKSLNKLLEYYINDPSQQHLKKANLISYWIKDFVNYIKFEEKFNPTKNISYKRGNIVKVNFGFNIGSEYGGLHYAVVLDKQNDHSSPVLTVIPLTSIKDNKNVHRNNLELGNEIYRLLKLKYDAISQELKKQETEIDISISAFTFIYNLAEQSYNDLAKCDRSSAEFMKKIDGVEKLFKNAQNLKINFENMKQHNADDQEYLEKIGNEISQMKEGSIALVNQITTISKLRIYDPKTTKGVLSGISLSEETMEKINQKMKELYIF